MKRKLQTIATASAASLIVFSALAQETPAAKKGGAEITLERSTRAMRPERLGRARKKSVTSWCNAPGLVENVDNQLEVK